VISLYASKILLTLGGYNERDRIIVLSMFKVTLGRVFWLTVASIGCCIWLSWRVFSMPSSPTLLTDPFLQLPTPSSVQVVWFTEFVGTQHTVTYGEKLAQKVSAKTIRLSRTYEDPQSKIPNPPPQTTARSLWRHEATVANLRADTRLPYQVTSIREDGVAVTSKVFSLAPAPSVGKSLKILLTSDHQLKPLVSANLQKATETIGRLDLVLFAGDLINEPDRASDWFDNSNGNAFFPPLQGRATYDLEKADRTTRYTGGEIIQHTPMYTAIGNHEVMGRFAPANSISAQFNDPVPKAIAQARYEKAATTLNPKNDPAIRAEWIKNHSFNTDTYEEIFSLPESPAGGRRYYAASFGDVRLIVLYATNVWRSPSLEPDTRGKYRERQQDFAQPDNWGWGQLIFEPIAKGSPQYAWLEQELDSPEFQQARYKIVMLHNPPHSLGENSVPAYTDPVQVIDRDANRTILNIRYEYPPDNDYLVRDVVPLLEKAGVQLVFYGHSHLWNRFLSASGMHFLETSNVGNSYGAYTAETSPRSVPSGYQERYTATGNPNGLAPVMPTIAPLQDAKGTPTPYITSNDVTVFSILDTAKGTIASYRFDTRQPNSPVVKFDEFELARRNKS
jgi:Calcineurin-like phosphoesterase